MTARRGSQRGAAGALALTIAILVMVGVLAGYLLSRIASSSASSGETSSRLAVAAAALDNFVATALRLPCPTDPTADDGAEVQAAAVGTCTFPEGAIPWKTVGMKREDALDAWGRKISYRVYTAAPGSFGSLTQPGGASMVECDAVEAVPGGVTAATGISAGGLCNPDPTLTLRNTTPALFLAGKGLPVMDGASALSAAYVLISHGVTGLGGYTVSGTRLDLPIGDERDNTRDTGTFRIKAFSDVDTEATKTSHFDDLLVYRTLPELVKRAGLSARDWPDDVLIGFSQASVEAAVGHAVAPGTSVGQTTVTFTSAQVSAFGSGGVAADVTFDVVGGVGGLGVATGGSALIQSSANEFLRIDIAEGGTMFAVTLGDFGTYGATTFREKVEFTFYLGGTQVGSVISKSGCNIDGGLASFSIAVGAEFDRVDITPVPSSDGTSSGITAFLVSEIKACAATGTCETSLAAPANTCP